MAIQASFAKKVARPGDCNDVFLALLGNNGEFDLALPDVKNSVRDLPLREYNLILAIFAYRFSVAHLSEKYFGIKRCFNSLPHEGSLFFFTMAAPSPDEGRARRQHYSNCNAKMHAHRAASP